ncbi:MAG TPA: sigma-E factor negative regulatory protein [Gammaproteobacteria bacterium]|jgi:sigma-E factor negative regulatory protein RseA
MTQKLREQISALCDHELPEGEHELLLRRFTVEKSLRLHWERYHLIGSAMRKELPAVDTRGLADRVMAVLANEPQPLPQPEKFMDKLLRGAAGVAVAASVAVVALIGIRHGAVHQPGLAPTTEIVPTSVAQGEVSPVNGANEANWNGEQLPIHASLDGALVDEEGPSQPLGKHGLQTRHLPVAASDLPQEPKTPRPPRQE